MGVIMKLAKLVWSAINSEGYDRAGYRSETVAWGLPEEGEKEFYRLIYACDGFSMSTVQYHSLEIVEKEITDWFKCSLLTDALRSVVDPR